MINKLLILLVVLSSSLSLANFDSSQISDSIVADTVKIKSLLAQAWELRSNDPLNAIMFANEANDLAQNVNDLTKQAEALNYLGVIHTNMGANEIALDYHLQALNVAKKSNDWVQVGYSHNNLGGVYIIKNNIDLASQNLFEAIKIFNEQNFPRGLAYSYLNLGRLYKDQENYKQSMKHLSFAMDKSKLLKQESIRAKILLEVAELLRLQGFYTSAENTYEELLEIYERLNHKKGLAEVWNSLCELNIANENYDTALNLVNKAIKFNREILNSDGEVENLLNLSEILLAKSQINQSEKMLDEALEKAKNINNQSLILSTFEAYYKHYKNLNQLSQALSYYEMFNSLKDSVVTKEEIVRLGELESLLRIQKAEAENSRLQSDLDAQKTQRNYVLVIALLALVFVGLISYRFYEKKKLSDELKEINTVKDKFFRIIAHDLREPFNAIFAAVELLKDSYSEMTEEETKEIIDTIGKSIKSDFDLLENLLFWARSQSDTIEFKPESLSLCNVLNNNIEIARSGINNKNIDLQINCEADLKVIADEQMLNTIIRNLLLNAIKFTHINGNIKIDCRSDENNVVIQIADSGIGMNEETLSNLFRLDKKIVSKGTAGEMGSGLGLILTKEFLSKHNGELGVESKFGEGSSFTIKIPKK
jgi:signal transduction histidine kinase